MGNILITGAGGFIGSKLVPLLREKGHSVSALHLDPTDFDSIRSPLEKTRWDTLIHLAAVSNVMSCEKNPGLAYRVNLAGTGMLVEAVRRYQPETHLIFTSTSQVYATPTGHELKTGVAFTEDHPILPQTLYAGTKWEAELILKDISERYRIQTTVLRLFNHTHHSQPADFFLPHLYQTMKNARKGEPISIPVGNLDVYRDIGSVQDLLGAFIRIIDQPAPSARFEIFNVCSGSPKHLQKLAEGLARRMGCQAKFIADPSRVRAGEARILSGSHEKLTTAVGWKPLCLTEEDLLSAFLK